MNQAVRELLIQGSTRGKDSYIQAHLVKLINEHKLEFYVRFYKWVELKLAETRLKQIGYYVCQVFPNKLVAY